MPTTEPAPLPVVAPRAEATDVALLASDARGRQIVSVHAKRTYTILPSGRCVPADRPVPFLIPNPEAGGEEIRDTDITPVKVGTDFILIASAHARRPGTRTLTARLAIDAKSWAFSVSGDRRCARGATGDLLFSEPAAFETIPLRYENAYGGYDAAVPMPEPKVLADVFVSHPGVYPRNPAGRGYVVHGDARTLEELVLPNVEHPKQRLTPENLLVGRPDLWWKQPIPWSCDWFDKTWYPRMAYFGGLPDGLPDDDSAVYEVRLGLIAAQQKARYQRLPVEELIDPRFTSAASPVLVRPTMTATEVVRLEGVTPHGKLTVTLPGERPRMFVRFEGGGYELTVVPHRILLSTEQMGVTIVWAGAWPTPRLLPDRFPRPGDDAGMELAGVEVFTDRRPVVALI